MWRNEGLRSKRDSNDGGSPVWTVRASEFVCWADCSFSSNMATLLRKALPSCLTLRSNPEITCYVKSTRIKEWNYLKRICVRSLRWGIRNVNTMWHLPYAAAVDEVHTSFHPKLWNFYLGINPQLNHSLRKSNLNFWGYNQLRLAEHLKMLSYLQKFFYKMFQIIFQDAIVSV